MGPRFVRYHPVVRRSERERMMFIFAACTAFGLLCAMILVLHNRSAEASLTQEAKQVQVPVEPARQTISTVVLFAPDRNITAGTKLSDVDFKEVYWPRNQVPEGAIRDRAEIRNQYAKSNLAAQLPLLRANLTNVPGEGPLPVRPGFRAISIEVDATSGLEGHALPGTRVDVLLTFSKDDMKGTKIIVQNARVLSYGGSIDSDPTSQNVSPAMKAAFSRRIPSSTITLEVIAGDALKIQTARSMGKLGLMMRPQEDTIAADITQMDENGVYGDRTQRSFKDDNHCSKGSVKISGREYSVGCDGQISQVIEPNEP